MGIHPTIEAATLGMWDSMIVMIMALVVFGPRRLPKIGRQIGKLMYEFRKASNDFRFQMEEEMRTAEEADRRQRDEAERQRALAAGAAQPSAQIESSTVAELSAVSVDEQPEEYIAGGDEDYRSSSYDEAAGEDYHGDAPEAKNEPVSEPEPAPLSVKPPVSGAPIPAERPTSRASTAPAEQHESASRQAGDMSAEIAAPQNLPASEAAETEPAAHHG
jgi:sec-independent protein translocase protein TatB